MTPLPPTYRTFVQPETLPENKSYPAPEGISLITSPVYTKVALFVEQDEIRGLIPINTLEKAIAKVLSKLYLYAGRLSPEPRGRFSVHNFDKGCLFQVCESSGSFEGYKKKRFGYGTAPLGDFMPLHQYASLDTPLMGVQLTQLQGGQVLGFSFLHRLSDGLADTIFIASLACVLRNEEPPFEMYYDWQRPPVQPNPEYDHSIDYPVMNEKPQRPTGEPDHNVKRVFVINRDKADELKRQVEHEMEGTNIKISVRDAITAFMYRAIVKAKRVKGKCDFVYVVGKRHAHPDTRLLQHFGNYFVAVTVPEQHDTLMRRSMSSTAQRIREQVAKVNPEFMDSLEYYLNHVEDPTKVCPPAHRMTPGCVMWSDWSRFSSGIDFGYGKNSRWCRSFVNPSFWPVVTLAPTIDDSFEIVVQLDPESMERLMHDKQVQYYTDGVF